jgi:hypothetical protein
MVSKNSPVQVGLFPNVLLITGSGRERGKTMLACNIIRKWKSTENIVAIKISPHIHMHDDPVNIVHRTDGYTICEEKAETHKDSGRFLAAGAARVFYIEATDRELLNAFHYVYRLIGRKSLILCESGGLGKLLHPGVMLFVQHLDDVIDAEKEALRRLSDHIVFSSGPELSDPSLILKVKDHCWNLIRNGPSANLSERADPGGN